MGNDAFISYSHAADGSLAPALERGMERLARPWYRVRALSVFRDQSDLALTPHLWETIQLTLDGARYLVALLSPEAAASKWVNQELAHWCAERGTAELLLVLTGGELTWDETIGDFSAASTAVPAALRHQFAAEPLYEDFRWARTGADLTLRNPAFRSAVARLASPIHGMPPDDLEGEDVRLRRRARRLARGGVAALGVLTVAATVASVVAVQQADNARARTAEAEARSGALAALDLPISRLDEAFVASLQAAGKDADNPDRFRSAQTLVGRYPRLSQLLPVEAATSPAVVSELAISAADQIGVDVLSIADGGAAHTLVRPQVADAEPVDLGDSIFVSYLAESSTLVTLDAAGGASLIDEDGTRRTIDGVVWALDSGSDRAVVARDDRQLLIVASTGDEIAELGPVSGGIWPLFTSEVVVAWSPGRLSLFDADDGVLLASGPTTVDPIAVFATTSGSVVATIEGPTDAPVLRRWERVDDALTASTVAVPVPVPEFSTGILAPSGDRFSAFGDAEHVVIDTVSGEVVLRPRGSPVRFDNSGRYIATGGNRLTVWDVETGEAVFAAPEPVKALAWSGGCDTGAVCRLGTVGAGLALWEPASRVRTVLAEEINAEAVALSRDGSVIASGGWGRTVAVWSARLLPDDREPTVVATTPGGRVVLDPSSGLIAHLDGDTVEIDDGSGTVGADVAGATDLRIVPGGAGVLVNETDRWELIDPSSGDRRPLDDRCRARLSAADMTGTYIAALDVESGLLAVCTVADGALVANANVSGGVAGPSAIAVDESGSVVVGGSSTFAVYTLVGDQLMTGTAVITAFGGDASPVSSAAFSQGRVAVGLLGSDGTDGPARGRVVVWDLLAGTEPISYDVDERDVVMVALLDDGRTLVTAARDAAAGALTVQVWESTNRRRLGRSLTGLTGDVLTLTGDASAVVASDSTGRVLKWELSVDPQADICDILGAPFDDRRLEQLALDRPSDPCR